ncbi:MAG: molecular chaperone DjlA [Bacteroidetes bacterium HGW-Bacteroidetes-15]|nr:MAG: molecular chaperone DjlA [Bacteroidetes bacterium HGW-Bacteroidetes-15]
MAKYGKWLGGGLGWVLLGPIGGILGFAIGSVLDSSEKMVYTGQPSRNSFFVSLLVLVAEVMKADGKVVQSELNFVKKYFIQNFGEDASREALMLLRDILKQSVPLKDVCSQIRANMDYPSRLQLMHFLFGIGNADGVIHPMELTVITNIGSWIGVSAPDFESIKSMFVDNLEANYKVLEIDQTATVEEIKKAYRRMALKHHPDKVNYLGEDIRKTAEEKFQKVNEAYEKIKKDRGFV